jgi:hypothetical protein
MKNLTINDVKQVAERLMTNFNQITTLEIKMELRSKGFKANQSEVSQYMMQLSNENGWIWDNKVNPATNSIYRIYTLPDGYLIDASTAINSATAATATPATTNMVCNSQQITYTGNRTLYYTNKNSVLIEDKDVDDTDMYDWQVSSVTSHIILYFDKKYTRDQVRCAYSKFTGVHFHNTRTAFVL